MRALRAVAGCGREGSSVIAPLSDRLRALSPTARAQLFERIGRVPGALTDIRYDWEGFWARYDQLVAPAELERYGLILFTGPRGCGKTRAAVELFNREILTGRAQRPRIFAANEADVDKAVVHGESGIMACLPREDRPRWMVNEGPAGVLRYRNGVEVLCFTVRSPEGAVSHAGDLDLYDDVAKWGPTGPVAWGHARVSCRLGYACGIVATTRRGTLLLSKLLKGDMQHVMIRRPADLRGNRMNLNASLFDRLAVEFAGDDLLRQEIDDEDVSSTSPFAALEFDQQPIRITSIDRNDIAEVIVAADPADGKGGDHDEWGIGAAARLRNRHVVALDDASDSFDDGEAGAAILALCERWGATTVVGESNRGVARLQSVIKAAHLTRELERGSARPRPMPELVPVTAREGKKLRAGPLRPLYLQGMLHHTPGLAKLERQQREWNPDGPKRPRQDDRIDWLVQAVHYLADLGDVVNDPSLQLDGLRERADAVQARVQANAEAKLQTFPGLPSSDPRSQARPSRQLGAWGVGGGRKVF